MLRGWVTGDFARGEVQPDTPLDLVLVHQTEQPPHRRADFFVDHLRPTLDTRFAIYTPEEAEALEADDPVLVAAQRLGEAFVG